MENIFDFIYTSKIPITLFGISFSLLTAIVFSYPKCLRLFAMVVALTVFGPKPKATILIPKFLKDLLMFLTASGSDGSPSVNVKKIDRLYRELRGH